MFNVIAMFAVLLAVLGLFVALFGGARPLIDRLIFRTVDFAEELRKNNLAVGIFLGALALGICIMASRAVGSPLEAPLAGRNSKLSRYDDAFRHEAHLRFGYEQDWRWFKGQGMTESKLDANVCSQVGACGVMQFMPGTAVAMGLQNRFDAHESIRAGIAYDRQLWDIFGAPARGTDGAVREPRPAEDRLAFVFSAYNWGVGNVQRKARPCARARSGGDQTWGQLAPCLPPETQAYFPRIRQWLQRFAGAN